MTEEAPRLETRPETPVLGLHHVTAIGRDPQENVDFYAEVLGLRMVKKTVNFDDPGTYHLYYADAVGSPGSVMTFFPWPGARLGRPGAGQTTATSFAVPKESIDFWAARLAEHGVDSQTRERFGEQVLLFRDPDGLPLELVASVGEDDPRPPWEAEVSAENAVRGFDGVTLTATDGEPSIALLTEVMGWRRVVEDGRRIRFEGGEGGSGARLDLVVDPGAERGLGGAGTVHHVAFRVADDEAQLQWRERLVEALQWPTDVKDRNYFHSIYFREPGGVLFEFATDPPGFAIDEPADALGQELKLPPWLESVRDRIESALPPITLPENRS